MKRNKAREICKYISSHRDGFTLIEIVVGIAILAIVMAAFLTFFAASFRLNTAVDNNSEASYLARSYMEQIYDESVGSSYASVTTKLTDATLYGFDRIGTTEEFDKTQDNYYIRIRFEPDTGGLYKVLVRIYDNGNLSGGKQVAQIEDVILIQ